jgi:O-antigen ligase
MVIDVQQQSKRRGDTRRGAAGDTPVNAPIAQTGAKKPARMYLMWTIVLVSLMVGKVGDWFPGLASIPLVKIAYLVAAISAFGGAGAALPSLKIRSSRIALAALPFLALAIMSIVFSIAKGATFAGSLYIMIVLLSIMLVLKVTQTLLDVEKVLLGFVAAGVSLTVGLILNYHGGRASINDGFDPNDIAYSLDTTLPLMLALRHRESRLARLSMGGLAVVTVLAILLTGSRGGAIGLGVVIIAVIAFPLSRDESGALKRFSVSRTLITCAILALVVALSWRFLPDATQQRMASLMDLGSDYNAGSENGSRTLIWRQDIGMVLKRPIGFGLNTVDHVNGLAGGQWRTAHNSFVQALVELGVLGLLLYIRALYTAWKELGRVVILARNPSAVEEVQKAALYARAIRTALAGNMAAGFFLSQAYSAGLWLLLATAATLVRAAVATPAKIK